MTLCSKILELGDDLRAELFDAVHSDKRVQGLTHSFYRYPARFSPRFAASAIKCFSKPGDFVLDPYMGGGTTIVEALAAGRRAIGNDLNSLGVFVTRAKTLRLTQEEIQELHLWAECISDTVHYARHDGELYKYICKIKTKNLNLHRSRFIKKGISQALISIEQLSSEKSRLFARCILLHVSQWALDGRRTHTSLAEFRAKLKLKTCEMLLESQNFSKQVSAFMDTYETPLLLNEGNASELIQLPVFADKGEKASLVLTSPPYPGVHVLYHRWQVDGRKETPAPYWIASCNDGEGASYYNFGDRHQAGLQRYFESSAETLHGIRNVMKDGAYMVQLVAFKDPKHHLPRYLTTMKKSGFREMFVLPPQKNGAVRRIWRQVPNRKWHASIKGKTHGSREVVLIHRAV